MSHQLFSPDRWPLFEMRTTELKERTLLHFSCDLLFIDVWSLQILHAELIQLAYQRTAHLPPLEISFRDYVLTAAQQRNSKSYRRAEQYWLRRLDTLPAAPKLPLAKSPVAITQPRFVRREAMLDHEVWRKLKSRSAKARTSLSGTLAGSVREGSGGVEPKSAFHPQHNSVPTRLPCIRTSIGWSVISPPFCCWRSMTARRSPSMSWPKG